MAAHVPAINEPGLKTLEKYVPEGTEKAHLDPDKLGLAYTPPTQFGFT